MRRDVVAVFL